MKPFNPYAAITPPIAAPIAAPRLLDTRESAVARWRSSGPTSEAISADWLGINAPFPSPAATAANSACLGVCATARPTYPTASATPAQAAVARAPIRSMAGPAIGAATTASPVMTPTIRPATPKIAIDGGEKRAIRGSSWSPPPMRLMYRSTTMRNATQSSQTQSELTRSRRSRISGAAPPRV